MFSRLADVLELEYYEIDDLAVGTFTFPTPKRESWYSQVVLFTPDAKYESIKISLDGERFYDLNDIFDNLTKKLEKLS